jgi:deazaflavin-dependent oxidoreductase (nitroreductase family)
VDERSEPGPVRRFWSTVLTSRAFRSVAPHVVPPFHRFVARVSGGRTLLDSRRQPMLILHTVGARTGQPRETPLAAVPAADDRIYVVGSNFAREAHPAWTANLMAGPDVEITFRGRRRPVVARLLSDEERAEVWPQLLEVFPAWERYGDVTSRPFRVFELTPPA